MKERIPAVIAVILLITLVLATYWAADYARRSIPVEPPRRITHEPDSWAEKFIMIRTDIHGMAINRMEGVTMQHYPDDDSYEVTTAKAIGQQPGSPITIGTSKTAIMDQDGSRVIMRGNAHLHRVADKDRAALDVKSEQLTLLPDEDIVFTDLPALVVNDNSTMNGTGMRYDNKTRTLQVFSASDVKISGQDSQTNKTSKEPSQTSPKP
ncbi:MAG TPA: LPS export ABC transporter periplasmic protein LptC [Eoetvoesiella sp.]